VKTLAIPANHAITFGPAPIKENLRRGDLGFDFYGTGWLTTSRTGYFARLKPAKLGYRECLQDQLDIPTLAKYRYSAGTRLCFVGHGVVAAIVIKDKKIDVPDPAVNRLVVSVIVWKGP
jgi:hypothetical protein